MTPREERANARCAWCTVGSQVDYHSQIGGPITLAGQTVESIRLMPNNFGLPVAWITNKTGAVSIDSLTPQASCPLTFEEFCSAAGVEKLYEEWGGSDPTLEQYKACAYKTYLEEYKVTNTPDIEIITELSEELGVKNDIPGENHDCTDFPARPCRICGKTDRPQYDGICNDGGCTANDEDDRTSEDQRADNDCTCSPEYTDPRCPVHGDDSGNL